MYEITIVTKHNTIHLKREEYDSPEMQEILSQPYIISYEIKKIGEKENVKKRDLP